MTRLRLSVLASALVALCALVAPARAAVGDLLDVRDRDDAPVKLIFDTDIGGDIDDAFALGLIHSFFDRGVCELIGVTITNGSPDAARFVAAVDARYGRPDIPIGYSPECYVADYYPTKVLEQTNDDGSLAYPVPENYVERDAVKLLRELLANAADHEVVIVQVGVSYNLAKLIETPPDDLSPLSGKELAARKVRLVSVMGGAFALDETAERYRKHKESNIISDLPAAQKFAKEWPTDVVYSGYEVGDRIRLSPASLKNDYSGRSTILRDAFWNWTTRCTNEGFDHRRPTWDLTSVLFVLRPEEGRGYYALSERGDVAFDDEGVTIFTPNPNGRSRCFLQDEVARARVEEAFVNLCSQP